MKRGLTAVLAALVLACALLAGCGDKEEAKPAGYTEEEIRAYAVNRFGEDVRYLSYEEITSEGGGAVYHFRCSDDVAFDIVTGVRRESGSAGTPGRTVRYVSDNYCDSVIRSRQALIGELITAYGLDVRINWTGGNSILGSVCSMQVFLENAEEIAECASLLTDINRVLALHMSDTSISGMPAPAVRSVQVYLQPDKRLPDDDTRFSWTSSAYRVFYRIGEVAFTSDGEELDTAAVTEQLTNDYVDRAKILGRKYYDPGDTLWSKYPAPVLRVTKIGETDVSDSGVFQLEYDRVGGEYWMKTLDPCQDFDGGPYEYEGRGTFARFVEDLGGLYFPGTWRASWSIDGSEWTAQLVLRETEATPYAFGRLQLICDNTAQTLSDVPAQLVRGGSGGSTNAGSNGTVSGRAYNLKDLQMLLHVDCEIDQEKRTAVFVKSAPPETEEETEEGTEEGSEEETGERQK